MKKKYFVPSIVEIKVGTSLPLALSNIVIDNYYPGMTIPAGCIQRGGSCGEDEDVGAKQNMFDWDWDKVGNDDQSSIWGNS